MDISSLASAATDMEATRTSAQVGTAVLKKALNIEAEGALALLQALPPVSSLPSHLGQNVNTSA